MKLAEMNGFPGLLQSTLSIPEEDNMFLRSSSSNVTSVFINWSKEGNCFEEGKKLQLLNKKAPAIVNSIDNALILTGVGIAGMITTTVLAVKATPKALQLIDNKKNLRVIFIMI